MSQVINYHGLAISKDKTAEFCHRWKITELALFGSVLRDDFRPDSDVDVLVTFAPEARWRFYDLLSMREELETIEVISIYSYRVSEVKRSASLQHLCHNGSFNRLFGYL